MLHRATGLEKYHNPLYNGVRFILLRWALGNGIELRGTLRREDVLAPRCAAVSFLFRLRFEAASHRRSTDDLRLAEPWSASLPPFQSLAKCATLNVSKCQRLVNAPPPIFDMRPRDKSWMCQAGAAQASSS